MRTVYFSRLSNLHHEPFFCTNIMQIKFNLLQTKQVNSRPTSLTLQASLVPSVLMQSTCGRSNCLQLIGDIFHWIFWTCYSGKLCSLERNLSKLISHNYEVNFGTKTHGTLVKGSALANAPSILPYRLKKEGKRNMYSLYSLIKDSQPGTSSPIFKVIIKQLRVMNTQHAHFTRNLD